MKTFFLLHLASFGYQFIHRCVDDGGEHVPISTLVFFSGAAIGDWVGL